VPLGDSQNAHGVLEFAHPDLTEPAVILGRVEIGHDDLALLPPSAGDEHDPAVLREDGRRLRAEHALTGGDLIGLGADGAFAVGDAGPPVEVHHLVVKEETGAADHDPRAVAAL